MKLPKPEERAQGTGTKSDLYIRLSDGESVTFVPRGEIYPFFSVFGIRGPVPPDTEGARRRYKLNAIVLEAGKEPRAKILEIGPQVYEQLYQISEVCELTNTKLRLSRKGTSKENTEYFLLPVMKEPLSERQIEALSKIELNILDKPPMTQKTKEEDDVPESWRGF